MDELQKKRLQKLIDQIPDLSHIPEEYKEAYNAGYQAGKEMRTMRAQETTTTRGNSQTQGEKK
nr:MAG: hypothetical protein [Microvirus sp.]